MKLHTGMNCSTPGAPFNMTRMAKNGLFATVIAPWQEALGKDVVITDTPVCGLRWNENGATVTTTTVTTTTVNNAIFSAPLVILAVPLGVLKHWVTEKMVVSPDLPACLARPIDRLGFGVENKVILRFDAGSEIARELSASNHDIFHTDDARFRRWAKGGTSRTVFCFDTAVQDGLANEDSTDTRDEANAVLHRMLGIVDVEPPAAFHVTRWQDDEYTRGAYSFMRAGSTLDDFHDLGKHHDECPAIVLAGEHCLSDGNGSEGTMHSAIKSGVHAAELALGSKQLDKQPDDGTDYTHDVIIVGGGLAGMSAASVLKRNGRDLRVVLIEAKSQCGGRVCSGTCGPGGVKVLARLRSPTPAANGSPKRKRRRACRRGASGAVDVDFGASFVMQDFVQALQKARPSQGLGGEVLRSVRIKAVWLSSRSGSSSRAAGQEQEIKAEEVIRAKKALTKLVKSACKLDRIDDSFGAAIDEAKSTGAVKGNSYNAAILNTLLRYEYAYVCTPDELSLRGVKETISS